MNHSIFSGRNWFPVIVAGFTVVLAAICYAVIFSSASQSENAVYQSSSPVVPAVTEERYRFAVTAVIDEYRAGSIDAQGAYDALIVLHVPASLQAFHIDCIIAFGKLIEGKNDEATARFSAVRAQYPWFSL